MSEMNNEINSENAVVTEEAKKENGMDFKFFKCCSATLKRLSVILFVVNLFIAVIAAVVAVIVGVFYMSADMLSLLAVPIVCAVLIMVVFARLLSAVVYGFAEIVEKHEK